MSSKCPLPFRLILSCCGESRWTFTWFLLFSHTFPAAFLFEYTFHMLWHITCLQTLALRKHLLVSGSSRKLLYTVFQRGFPCWGLEVKTTTPMMTLAQLTWKLLIWSSFWTTLGSDAEVECTTWPGWRCCTLYWVSSHLADCCEMPEKLLYLYKKSHIDDVTVSISMVLTIHLCVYLNLWIIPWTDIWHSRMSSLNVQASMDWNPSQMPAKLAFLCFCCLFEINTCSVSNMQIVLLGAELCYKDMQGWWCQSPTLPCCPEARDWWRSHCPAPFNFSLLCSLCGIAWHWLSVRSKTRQKCHKEHHICCKIKFWLPAERNSCLQKCNLWWKLCTQAIAIQRCLNTNTRPLAEVHCRTHWAHYCICIHPLSCMWHLLFTVLLPKSTLTSSICWWSGHNRTQFRSTDRALSATKLAIKALMQVEVCRGGNSQRPEVGAPIICDWYTCGCYATVNKPNFPTGGGAVGSGGWWQLP